LNLSRRSPVAFHCCLVPLRLNCPGVRFAAGRFGGTTVLLFMCAESAVLALGSSTGTTSDGGGGRSVLCENTQVSRLHVSYEGMRVVE